MTSELSIPGPNGPLEIPIRPGTSIIMVGANGGGKTRLAAYIENALQLRAHRISAHRALTLNPGVAKITESQALSGLRTGSPRANADVTMRKNSRWQGKYATALLSDFDFLIQALFADQAKKSLESHRQLRDHDFTEPQPTKFEQLTVIWKRLLPDRELEISGDDIQVSIPGSDDRYGASEMSDGERAIFYLLGQTLVAADESVLIFDEPELHVHRSIMSNVWDELEAVRPDCAFVLITHDLEFAASRVAEKFVIRDFSPASKWIVEKVPEGDDFDEEITTLILGSRRPVLFVEGTNDSLDHAIYRCCFPEWTIIPRSSCGEVLHSVVTMRRNSSLTRVTCAGIIDADAFLKEEIDSFNKYGVAILPVSEIENLLLLPDVSRVIAECEGYRGEELESKLIDLRCDVLEIVNSLGATNAVVARYCHRRIDRILKKIDLSDQTDISEIAAKFRERTNEIDIESLANDHRSRIERAVKDKDLTSLLKIYDHKGFIAKAASHLKGTNRSNFLSWLTRIMMNEKEPALATAIKKHLPNVQASS